MGPYNARKMPFSDLVERSQITVFAFFDAFSLRCHAFWGGNCHSPCGFARLHSEMSLHVAWFELVAHQPPGNSKIKVFGLGGWLPYDLPKLCRKKWVDQNIRFLRVEIYDLPRLGGFRFCFVCIAVCVFGFLLFRCCYFVVVVVVVVVCSLLFVVVGCCWLWVGVVVLLLLLLLLLFVLLCLLLLLLFFVFNCLLFLFVVLLLLFCFGCCCSCCVFPQEHPNNKNNNKTKPCFIVFFLPWSLARLCPERERERGRKTNNTKQQKNKRFVFVLFCFSSLLCFILVLIFLSYSFLYSIFSCFFVLSSFLIFSIIFFSLPPFPSNFKEAEEGKKK